MAKNIDEILMDYVGYSRKAGQAREPNSPKLKQALIEYFMGIVGEMEQRETFDYSLSSWTSDDMKAFGRNELRIEIRAKLKESVE